VQLLKESGEDVNFVNQELHKMGYNIGVRLIDEFLVLSGVQSCANFQETADVISKVGLKMFLGITAEVSSWSENGKSFKMRLPKVNNPLTEFVELPAKYSQLVYGNLLCGVIRGALEMVQLSVDCYFTSDTLRGDDFSEVEVVLKEIIQERIEKEE
jgi:hypothetical protein